MLNRAKVTALKILMSCNLAFIVIAATIEGILLSFLCNAMRYLQEFPDSKSKFLTSEQAYQKRKLEKEARNCILDNLKRIHLTPKKRTKTL